MMKLLCLFCFIFWIAPLKVDSMQDVYYRVIDSNESNLSSSCNELHITLWKIKFHECFSTKKINDGGHDLEAIVDRILGHAEACVETSSSSCIPDFNGFKNVLSKVFEQMKDYTNMYLEDIIKGRDKIKDLKCVEDTLSWDSYDACFHDLQPPNNKTAMEFKDPFSRQIRDGINCTNNAHVECSKEARTSLNRIVRNIFGLEQPPEEGDMPVKPPPPPAKSWYNYITDPIVAAWESVKKFFSNLFG